MKHVSLCAIGLAILISGCSDSNNNWIIIENCFNVNALPNNFRSYTNDSEDLRIRESFMFTANKPFSKKHLINIGRATKIALEVNVTQKTHTCRYLDPITPFLSA